jgi:hypothetical protein
MSSMSGIIWAPGAYRAYRTAYPAWAAPPLALGMAKWYGATYRPAFFAAARSVAAHGLT